MIRTNRKRSRAGVATAELAVCLPIIVLMVIATIEACSMVFLKQSLAIAAYEGARTAIMPNATASQVRAASEQVLEDRRISGGVVTVTPSNISSLAPGDFVDVTVSAPCGSNTIVPNQFYRGRQLSSTASMMIEY